MLEIKVDARGLACPLPVVNTKKAIEGMNESGKVLVYVDNEIAVQNLLKFSKQKGFVALGNKKGDKDFEVVITVGEVVEEKEEVIECAIDATHKGMVVVLSSSCMGVGDEKLGKALMKAFVFALTKQDQLPEKILCYNTGAYLTCEDADTLDDLKSLEASGVEILTCGTCLDFYGIKDKLAVGNVTNMYEIVEVMETAGKIVKP